jgi:hypothetical protein
MESGMRFLSRFIGLLFAAGAFVAFVIDGTKSIADSSIQTEPVGAVWLFLDQASFVAAQEAIQRNFSPVLWDRVIQPILSLPLFVALMIVAAIFLLLGRRPRSRIGYAVRG